MCERCRANRAYLSGVVKEAMIDVVRNSCMRCAWDGEELYQVEIFGGNGTHTTGYLCLSCTDMLDKMVEAGNMNEGPGWVVPRNEC